LLWVGSCSCKKFLRDFLARTFAFIARFRLVLQILSCHSKMVSNAVKRYKMHQYMSLD